MSTFEGKNSVKTCEKIETRNLQNLKVRKGFSERGTDIIVYLLYFDSFYPTDKNLEKLIGKTTIRMERRERHRKTEKSQFSQCGDR